MKLDVTPGQQPSDKFPRFGQSSLNALRENSPKTSTVFSKDEAVVHSPQKRKVSKPEVNVAEAVGKRRCRDGRPFSNGPSESVLQDVLEYTQRNGVDALRRPGDSQVPQRGVVQPVEMQCDSGLSFMPPSPVASNSTTSDDVFIPERRGLHQEDILHNYHEFADRRLFKDAGLIISPVSDGERRAYESIFLGDSDERLSSSEVGSQDLDATMSDG
jgi:hypothetical protein